jgi:hypothetical protein
VCVCACACACVGVLYVFCVLYPNSMIQKHYKVEANSIFNIQVFRGVFIICSVIFCIIALYGICKCFDISIIPFNEDAFAFLGRHFK